MRSSVSAEILLFNFSSRTRIPLTTCCDSPAADSVRFLFTPLGRGNFVSFRRSSMKRSNEDARCTNAKQPTSSWASNTGNSSCATSTSSPSCSHSLSLACASGPKFSSSRFRDSQRLGKPAQGLLEGWSMRSSRVSNAEEVHMNDLLTERALKRWRVVLHARIKQDDIAGL